MPLAQAQPAGMAWNGEIFMAIGARTLYNTSNIKIGDF